MANPNDPNDPNDPYNQLSANLRRQGDLTKQAAQRRLQTQFGSRLPQNGALIKLSADTDQQNDANTENQIANVGLQKAATEQSQQFQAGENEKNRGLQQQGIDLAKSQFAESKSEWQKEFEENTQTNLFNKLININKQNTGSLGDVANILGINVNDPTFGGLVARSRATGQKGLNDYLAQA